jgi:hypothetical protein
MAEQCAQVAWSSGLSSTGTWQQTMGAGSRARLGHNATDELRAHATEVINRHIVALCLRGCRCSQQCVPKKTTSVMCDCVNMSKLRISKLTTLAENIIDSTAVI